MRIWNPWRAALEISRSRSKKEHAALIWISAPDAGVALKTALSQIWQLISNNLRRLSENGYRCDD
jgi:hypothetical protein